MAHLEVRVDGVLKYEGEVPSVYLPEQPSSFPAALGAPGAAQRPTPLARVYLLGVLGPMLAESIKKSPLLQPIDATCEMRKEDGGFVITASGPAIDFDQLKP